MKKKKIEKLTSEQYEECAKKADIRIQEEQKKNMREIQDAKFFVSRKK
mgnify:CR=1 FL=1